MDASNVQLYCPTCRRGVRIGHRYDEGNGQKHRYCKKCGNSLGSIGRPRPAHARKKG